MKKIETIEELHWVLLNIGMAFHQVCEDAHIPYYMAAGTLLGAVRHKGFIPWDDDMDFVVPRVYFDKLKQILKDKLPSQYSVLDKEDGIVVSDIYKIVDNRTEVYYRWSVDSKVRFGVSIDIFPLDFAKSKWKNKLIFFLRRVQGIKGLDASNRPFPKNLFAHVAKVLLVFTGEDAIQKMINKRLIENSGPYLVNHYGAYVDREVMPKSFFGIPVLMQFENTEFYGVQDPHAYLSKMYGDYMIIPPETERHTHIDDMYWK